MPTPRRAHNVVLQAPVMTAILAFCLSACGRPESIADLKVHNGVLVNDPIGPVRKVTLNCSGTFLGPRVFVTAGHCDGRQVLSWDDSRSLNLDRCLSGAEATDEQVGGGIRDWLICRTDVDASAIGVNRYAPVSMTPASPNDRVVFMGYGYGDKIRQTGSGKLRKGSGALSRAEIDTLEIAGVPARNGQATSPGDSGGPWFNDRGELIGIHRSGTPTLNEDDIISFQATPVLAPGFAAQLRQLAPNFATEPAQP